MQLLYATTLHNYFMQLLHATTLFNNFTQLVHTKNETCLCNFHFDCVNEICINFVILSHSFIGSAALVIVDDDYITLMLELFVRSSFFSLDRGKNRLGRS